MASIMVSGSISYFIMLPALLITTMNIFVYSRVVQVDPTKDICPACWNTCKDFLPYFKEFNLELVDKYCQENKITNLYDPTQPDIKFVDDIAKKLHIQRIRPVQSTMYINLYHYQDCLNRECQHIRHTGFSTLYKDYHGRLCITNRYLMDCSIIENYYASDIKILKSDLGSPLLYDNAVINVELDGGCDIYIGTTYPYSLILTNTEDASIGAQIEINGHVAYITIRPRQTYEYSYRPESTTAIIARCGRNTANKHVIYDQYSICHAGFKGTVVDKILAKIQCEALPRLYLTFFLACIFALVVLVHGCFPGIAKTVATIFIYLPLDTITVYLFRKFMCKVCGKVCWDYRIHEHTVCACGERLDIRSEGYTPHEHLKKCNFIFKERTYRIALWTTGNKELYAIGIAVVIVMMVELHPLVFGAEETVQLSTKTNPVWKAIHYTVVMYMLPRLAFLLCDLLYGIYLVGKLHRLTFGLLIALVFSIIIPIISAQIPSTYKLQQYCHLNCITQSTNCTDSLSLKLVVCPGPTSHITVKGCEVCPDIPILAEVEKHYESEMNHTKEPTGMSHNVLLLRIFGGYMAVSAVLVSVSVSLISSRHLVLNVLGPISLVATICIIVYDHYLLGANSLVYIIASVCSISLIYAAVKYIIRLKSLTKELKVINDSRTVVGNRIKMNLHSCQSNHQTCVCPTPDKACCFCRAYNMQAAMGYTPGVGTSSMPQASTTFFRASIPADEFIAPPEQFDESTLNTTATWSEPLPCTQLVPDPIVAGYFRRRVSSDSTLHAKPKTRRFKKYWSKVGDFPPSLYDNMKRHNYLTKKRTKTISRIANTTFCLLMCFTLYILSASLPFCKADVLDDTMKELLEREKMSLVDRGYQIHTVDFTQCALVGLANKAGEGYDVIEIPIRRNACYMYKLRNTQMTVGVVFKDIEWRAPIVYQYTTCAIPKEEIVTSRVCPGTWANEMVEQCYRQLSEYPAYYVNLTLGKYTHSGGCFLAGNTVFCGKCMPVPDVSSCVHVYKVKDFYVSMTICLNILGDTLCREVSGLSTTETDMFKFLFDFPSNKEPKLFVLDELTNSVLEGPIAKAQTDELLFGQPQYKRDLTVLHAVRNTGAYLEHSYLHINAVWRGPCVYNSWHQKHLLQLNPTATVDSKIERYSEDLDTLGVHRISIKPPKGFEALTRDDITGVMKIINCIGCYKCGMYTLCNIDFKVSSTAFINLKCDTSSTVTLKATPGTQSIKVKVVSYAAENEIYCKMLAISGKMVANATLKYEALPDARKLTMMRDPVQELSLVMPECSGLCQLNSIMTTMNPFKILIIAGSVLAAILLIAIIAILIRLFTRSIRGLKDLSSILFAKSPDEMKIQYQRLGYKRKQQDKHDKMV